MDQVTKLIEQIEKLQLELGTMKKASNERCERDQRETQGTQTDAESEMQRDQRESQAAAETPGRSAETTEDANVGDDRTTHEANTVAEEHSALQAENPESPRVRAEFAATSRSAACFISRER